MMNFIYFALGKQSLVIDSDSSFCTVFSNYADYLEQNLHADGFIVEGGSDDTALSLLKQLRGAVDSFRLPIFVCGHSGDLFEMLSDGDVTSLTEAVSLSGPLIEQLERLQHDHDEYSGSPLLRILTYLFLRPETVIRPLQRWDHPYLYSYPLVEALAGDSSDGLSLITTLKNRKFITVVDFIDRVRHCPLCQYAHFNFVDICPECHSIDIEKKSFLHCFTCGNVAPQEDFVRDNILICPQCLAQLRHIGADYDRPLEDYICRSCDHLFQEPSVIAHCQHCGQKNRPDELAPRPVYSYRGTDRVEYAVRTGELDDVYNLFDELQNINPLHFTHTVDWQLNICRRYTEEFFSLVGIRVTNLADLHKKIGRYRLIELVDSYISRIRETVRTTDLTTRTVDDIIWILLPKTDLANRDIVVSRLVDLQSLTLQDEGIGLECEVATFCSVGNIVEGESGEQLLSRLEGDMT